ncbi:hypothetical protein MAM1_0103c05322 [Mucor ambiguus]|uniref:Uncharacterized protein n=1 Tax=Mucor ambiguus TaxID=91626 RepID=A0A0C9M756_9FUNG|nr:hypothetical protein MAM1_0103c05322 [Mucor ambiguus]
MTEQGKPPRPSYQAAVLYYKAIAERGYWLKPTVEGAYTAYLKNDKEGAFLNWMLVAKRGYEVAQSNVTYVLNNDKKMLDRLPLTVTATSHGTRSTNQPIWFQGSRWEIATLKALALLLISKGRIPMSISS